MIELIINLVFFLVPFAAGYFIGSKIEKKHYEELTTKEQSLSYLPAVTGKNFLEDRPIAESRMVMANVVICSDYFKEVVTSLRNILGGRIFACETLVDRARREAVVRLKEQAKGSDIIVNLRLVSSRIGVGTSIEAMAYGTAIKYQQ